jgi:plasmid stabilization system protein ParE
VIIVWSPRAIEHLAHLRSHIARDNPKAANRIADALLDAVERLAELPNLGPPGRVAGTRELVVPGTPYVIPSRPRGDRLEVIAVFHGRQKWPSVCKRGDGGLGVRARDSTRMQSGSRPRGLLGCYPAVTPALELV